MTRALILVLVLLASCSRLENLEFHITNTWYFDETRGTPRDTVRPPWEDPDV